MNTYSAALMRLNSLISIFLSPRVSGYLLAAAKTTCFFIKFSERKKEVSHNNLKSRNTSLETSNNLQLDLIGLKAPYAFIPKGLTKRMGLFLDQPGPSFKQESVNSYNYTATSYREGKEWILESKQYSFCQTIDLSPLMQVGKLFD